MTGITIAPVADTAFALMEVDEEEKASVEALAVKFREATNWFARKKMFLELFDELDETADAAAELAESPEFAALLAEASEEMAKELREMAAPGAGAPPGVAAPDGAQGRLDLPEPDDNELEEWLPEDPFAVVVPLYVGAILERLEEPSIMCLEQAAFYFLSTHPEHQEAAKAWLEADPKRLSLFRKFIRANPGYDDAARRIMADEDGLAED